MTNWLDILMPTDLFSSILIPLYTHLCSIHIHNSLTPASPISVALFM